MSSFGSPRSPGLEWATKSGTVRISYDAQASVPARGAAVSIERALSWHQGGDLNRAEAVYRMILREEPGHAEALHLLGLVAHQRGDHGSAVELIKQALKENPDAAVYHHDCAQAQIALGAYESAVVLAERALAISADYIQAYNTLGIALAHQGHFSEAIEQYRLGLRIDPYNADLNCNLANACANLGQSIEAADHYERAVQANPRHANAQLQLALTRPDQTRVAHLDKLADDPALPYHDRAMSAFAAAHILDGSGDYAAAFERYERGNTCIRDSLHYNAGAQSELVSMIIESFPRDFEFTPVPASNDGPVPIFIVGMPRSGTTLVEQIVSGHRDVHGGGELSTMPMLERALCARSGDTAPYPALLARLDSTLLSEGAATYRKQLRKLNSTAPCVSDKMPMNFMRLGLIAQLFPDARIVHCTRDARDLCLSNFRTCFGDPLSNRFTYDLYELGRFHRDYARLMTHWQDLLAERITEVEYESLVANPTDVTRKLLAALDLSWDERCLDFTSNPRAVRTASIHQVRRPVYADSIARWKHYEAWLAPLFEGLAG